MVELDFPWRICAVISAQNHPALLDVNRFGGSANEFRPMQTAAQRCAYMAGFEAAPRHFREHRSKKKSVCVAHQGDEDRAVRTESFFQTLRRPHAAESAAQNHDPFCYRRHLEPGFWFRAEHMLCDITEALGDEAERGTVQHPANQSWKMCSHLLRTPLRHPPGNQWERDHADQAPQWHTQCTGINYVVHIGAAGRTRNGGIR